MFYETAQTVGPGWHRSFKPPHFENMNWSPNKKNVRSPGSSPETYRRIIRDDDDDDDCHRRMSEEREFFGDRGSPPFPRRIFKEVWDKSSPNHRFAEKPRMFKRVFKPSSWENEFEDCNIPTLSKMERNFDRNFDRTRSKKFHEDFERRFNAPDDEPQTEGRVHHIPILVERKLEEMKSRFKQNPPPSEKFNESESSEDWTGPQVQNLRRNFEPQDKFSNRFNHVKQDFNSKPRPFHSSVNDRWDPHAIHTLPTRKGHKASQSFDDSRHPVTPKSVYRSYSETNEDLVRPQQPHSAAFRSHSDGHCPDKTFINKVEIDIPKESTEDQNIPTAVKRNPSDSENSFKRQTSYSKQRGDIAEDGSQEVPAEISLSKSKSKLKLDGQSLQQITVILQNVEDLIVRVEAYNGTGRDKQFRFLDEMLTRCMLRLDDVETEGREDIRSARKDALKQVQKCIDKLEAKAYECEERHAKKCQPKYEEDHSQNEGVADDSELESLPMYTSEPNEEPIPMANGDIVKEPIPLSYTPIRDEPIYIDDSPMKNSAIPLCDKPQDNNGGEEKTKL